jgi:hypothetical protein
MDALERIADDPVTAGLYADLMEQVRQLGPHLVKPTKTSVQLRGTHTFATIHPRRASILLTIVLDIRLISARSRKQQQVSTHRWHNDVLITTGGEIDRELVGWLEDAYALNAPD